MFPGSTVANGVIPLCLHNNIYYYTTFQASVYHGDNFWGATPLRFAASLSRQLMRFTQNVKIRQEERWHSINKQTKKKSQTKSDKNDRDTNDLELPNGWNQSDTHLMCAVSIYSRG